MCHIHCTGLSSCQCRILFHEKYGYFFHRWCFSIIIRIRLKDYLLSFIPLFHNITSGTDWILSVIFIIRMFRNNTNDRHGIRPYCKRCVHMEFYRCIIYCHCFFQHGKIIDRAVITTVIISKCHIFRSQWLSICKLYIITDLYRPGKTILTH